MNLRAVQAGSEMPTKVPAPPQMVNLQAGFPPTRGIVFDMDGTLVQPSIDFKTMRAKTGIRQGDLFTQMQLWEDESRIESAMEVIEELEASATAKGALVPMTGLARLLEMLREAEIHVALVTRNTMSSVKAFFDLLEDDRLVSLFSVVLTREFRHVKPDKRIMQHIADEWGMHPSELMMVGDSKEDVEVGNAGGSMTCLVLGGGNEVQSSTRNTIKEGNPTLSVSGLEELADAIEAGLQSPPQPASLTSVLKPLEMDFIDQLFIRGHLQAGYCTFPRLTKAFGCDDVSTYLGDTVLHHECSDGFLTKLFGSLGITVTGSDSDPANLDLVRARGLHCLAPPDIKHASFNASIAYADDWLYGAAWSRNATAVASALKAMASAVKPGGTVAVELAMDGNAAEMWDALPPGFLSEANAEPMRLKDVIDVAPKELRVLSSEVVIRELTFSSAGEVARDVVGQVERNGGSAAGVEEVVEGSGITRIGLRRGRVVFRR